MADNNDELPKSVDDKGASQAKQSNTDGGDDTNNDTSQLDGETKDAAAAPDADNENEPVKRRSIGEKSEDAAADDEPMPTLPLKKARTAYFIFADEKREMLKEQVRIPRCFDELPISKNLMMLCFYISMNQHKGEGVAALARATGELWSALDATQRKVYETQAAEERDRVSRDMQRLKDAGLWPEAVSGEGGGETNDDGLILPVARIRKICKLDPDVKGMSKESTMLIAKATELFCVKLGNECVTMAQMQNRRKLLPEDVVEVCSMKERFMFLKDDLKDLAKEQLQERKEKEKEEGKPGAKSSNHDDGKATSSLFNYFSKS
ncbi:hypothetical protein ACHAWO_013147 [Cyclotella atomus]|uniref:HMG box domain-containing protein n=1 Tax=Cyclotella atomus TaxID=382360 RepID=A0ABD3N3S3_9STRA